jgi:site-specific DNA-adenine methylase
MFSYFGSKSKLVKKYQAPKHDLIIEPFAGSARYALEYFDRQVIINDVNPKVIAVWQYLKDASVKDVMSLPVLAVGEHIDNFDLTDAEKWLIGFELCRGKFEPRKVVSQFSNWESARKRIAANLYKIKHWQITSHYYRYYAWSLLERTTWFVDPPYQLEDWNKHSYPFRQIDYLELAKFCQSRFGQVIVCGGTFDNYLPFETLTTVWNGRTKLGREKVYYCEN